MSSSSVIIRRLHCADVLQLRKLNALFAGAFGEQETYGGEPSDAYLQGLLAKEHVIAIVAMTGDEVIGGLVAYELDKFERMRREFYIYDLAVGHLCSGRPWRCARHALYEKLGTREEVLHFDIVPELWSQRGPD
jgi:aminoglycoside 3-N-acetyltransferase I